MNFALVWYTTRRDWRWLWLRKQTTRHMEPIRPYDMTKITALRPETGWFAELLEKEGVTLV